MNWETLFTVFFITLGPVKLIVPFATLTREAAPSLKRAIALRSFAVSLVTVVAMFFFGRNFLGKFNVGIDTVRITAGLILLLWSLAMLRQPVDSAKAPEASPALSKTLAMIPLTVPYTLTPQGIAAVVLLSYIVADRGPYETFQVLAMLAVVMILNLLAMFFASRLLRWLGGTTFLQIVGSVLAILQAVLGTQILVNGLKGVGFMLKGS